MKKHLTRFSAFLTFICVMSFASGCAMQTNQPVLKPFRPSVKDAMTRGSAEQVVIQNKAAQAGEK